VFCAIAFFLHRPRPMFVMGSLAVAFTFFAVIAPKLLEPVEIVWMKFAHILGAINTRIIMGIMYFVVIVPMGLVMRAFGKDGMNRQWRSGAKTNWEDYRERQRNTKHYENMF
jgi:hypothetical protein